MYPILSHVQKFYLTCMFFEVLAASAISPSLSFCLLCGLVVSVCGSFYLKKKKKFYLYHE